MMYPYMTLADETEIVHSHYMEDERVKVYVEKPYEKDCFHHMTCYLPECELEDVFGFTEAEVNDYLEIIRSNSHLIMKYAKHGGVENIIAKDYIVHSKELNDTLLIEEAFLSSDHDYTIFKYADYRIRFRAPYSLEKYTEVKEWDNGYLVVMAKYKHNEEPEEEYIDLIPILEKLYIDAAEFVQNIKNVRVRYE